MTLLVVVHAVVALLAPAAARPLGRRVFLWTLLAPAATLVWLAGHLGTVLDGGAIEEAHEWVPGLQLELAFRLDTFGALMVLLVSGIGALVMAYSVEYFPDRPDLGRFAMYLCAFSGAMLGLVLADNLLLIFVFWELTSVTSYLLIGFDDTKESSRKAALQAILITGAGGLAMLGGLVLLGQASSSATWSLSEILADPPTEGAVVAWAVVLVLAGAFTKSAQVPFHMWLPGAMAAPTPVSAYLHSATMVKAGVYLIARMSPAFADVGLWRPLTAGVGVATMLWGAYRALRQYDLKLVLAFGTISQLGFLVALLGWGDSKLVFAGTAMLLAHALFKAALFMVVGVVDHQAHSRDLRRLSGLGRRLPLTAAVATLAALSMAGVPPLLGFVSKEAGFLGYLDASGTGSNWVLAGLVAGSVLTTAYTARFLWGAFAAKPQVEDPIGAEVPRPPAAFVVPAALLAALSLVGGLVTALADELVRPAAAALYEPAGEYHLHLWPGFTLPLLLSGVALAGGVLLFLARRPVAHLQSGLAVGGGADVAFHAGYAALIRGAAQVTRIVQPGSLSFYVSMVLITFAVVPGVVLVRHLEVPDGWVWAESPLQAVIAVLVLVGAIGTVLTRRRFAAVLALGTVGYGVALLFVVQGAPDLALTQFLIETVSLVLFLMVLRRLPDRFARRRTRSLRVAHLGLSLAVGAAVFGLALTSLAARTDRPIGEEMSEVAYPEGGGANAVNVILADIRAFDTLGEIVVITVAAIGTAALVRAGRPPRRQEDVGVEEERTGAALDPADEEVRT
ncbi:hydrogen gas-evolving membrane-bound hydrogenase subunit E [Actinomarinicola tropica]|uniref:hydrogen gas-evolving membrane-bound hydrogenase subunit E n=1 Tax=Actinomarinicola tropica TaxID=2789776 RepID=UPI00189B4ED1|nr:hydrogen gas-evolving membrane-bound hydrogenase subunit E [Actinomarinicola tropica]